MKRRERMLNTSRQYQIGTYMSRFVSPVFQRMIRAEAAAMSACMAPAIVAGQVHPVWREVTQCVCVTCGVVRPWSGGLGGMHTGHFLAGRWNSIVLAEDNVAPQCSKCNRYRGGAPQEFRQWMLAVRGPDIISRLEWLRDQTRPWMREELVDLRLEFQGRLKAAQDRMASA